MLLFKEVDEKLTKDEPLPSKNSDHALTGNWHGHRDCHIAPDWLLMYRVFEKEQEIEYVRMGSHAELFG